MNDKWRCRAWLLLLALAIGGAAAVRADDQSVDEARRADERIDRNYERGQRNLERREWDKAIEAYDEVIRDKGTRTDGAMYWKAYSLNKLGRRPEAIAVIDNLVKAYPASRWINDAKALQIEVRQAGNQPVRPEDQSDEDMKLIAIQSLLQSDSDRAFPLLEKVLQSSNSLRVKERALFVLAQTGSPKARDVLARVAKGNSNPDLQAKAIEYLGVFGGSQNSQLLNEIYDSTQDVSLRRRILQSFMITGDKGRMLTAAKSEKNPELRRKAVELLGAMGAREELWQMYQNESSPEVRRSIMHGMFISGDSKRLLEIARSDKDAQIRRSAVHQLGTMGREQSGEGLLAIYSSDQDKEVRRAALEGLFIQGNAKALIDIARKETDPVLRKAAVEKLAQIHSKESTDFMMELLNKD